MAQYIARRVLQAIPVVFLIAVVSFLLMQAAPGGPAVVFNQNPRISVAQKTAFLEHWCLEDKPDAVGMLREFGGWLGVWNCHNGGGFFSASGAPNFLPAALGGGVNGVLHGDFGYSIFTGRPVLDMIGERVPATLVLMTIALVIWVTLAILLGVIAAVRRYSLFDQAVTFFSYVFYSLPTFWLGLILIFIFAVDLRLLPPQGIVDTRSACGAFNTAHYWDCFWKNPGPNLFEMGRHLILPVITLVAVNVAGDSRFVRGSMLDTLSQDYVRTARAKGLTRTRVVFRHAFRNAMLPILTNVALEIAFLFGGAIVTETIFNWPGMGRLYIDGVGNRDYFLLMGILLIGSVLVVIMNLVADVIYAWADPRIRY
jgi:peptide/nickel transport system permease protein